MAEDRIGRRCGDCIHYVKEGTRLNQGHCHRFPPTAIGIPVQGKAPLTGQPTVSVQFMATFPAIQSDCSGCAEYSWKGEYAPFGVMEEGGNNDQ